MLKRVIEKNSAIHCFVVEKIRGTLVLTSRFLDPAHRTCPSPSRAAVRTNRYPEGCFSSILCCLLPTDGDSAPALMFTGDDSVPTLARRSYQRIWVSLQLQKHLTVLILETLRNSGPHLRPRKCWGRGRAFLRRDLCSFRRPLSPSRPWVTSTFRLLN